MALIYKFKKEMLLEEGYAFRPRIPVTLHGKDMQIDVPALIDSGCDVTVVPEELARALGLNMNGKRTKIYAYRESTEVIQSTIDITFVGKAGRESVRLNKIPILIALATEEFEDEADITLGVSGIFDNFDITFKKKSNRIILKKI